MKKTNLVIILVLLVVGTESEIAQVRPQQTPDVSNKALITKSTPGISNDAFKNQGANATEALRKMAEDYYAWRNENYPVRSSDAGLHTSVLRSPSG